MNKTIKMSVIAFVVAMVVIAIGLIGYNMYHETMLENGAYKFLETELYGDVSDLDVIAVNGGENGYYDITYSYTRNGGDPIHATWSHAQI